MKLKITDVMICEWDAETMCMIVSPAEGWKVNVNYPISEAHASMVTMEKMDPDYSWLANKWLRSIGGEDFYTKNKWYKVATIEDSLVFVIDDDGDEFGWERPQTQFDLTDARDYNPDEEPDPKPHNALTFSELEDGKSYLLCKQTAYDKYADKIATEGYYYEASPTFRLFASELTKGIDHGTDHEFISKYFEKHVHQPKPERKPHQLKEYDAVECTPEERAEIIRIADECGVPVYNDTRTPKDLYPSLSLNDGILAGLRSPDKCVETWSWHTVPDFISKIRGQYTAVNVTEHKHPQIV